MKKATRRNSYVRQVYAEIPRRVEHRGDSIGWIQKRLEWGDIESVRAYFDYNPNNAYELGYTKEDLMELGIFTKEEIEEREKY